MLFLYSMIFGLIAWLLFIKNEKISSLFLTGLALAFVVAIGVIIDKWFYGTWTLSCWNYFDQNILRDKVSGFGVYPWWWFLSSGSLTLRVCRDSLVWFSVTKLGIEISRGIIRADSAFVLDVWNKEYWSGSLMEISQKYNVPAQFSDMQAVLFPTLDPMATYMFSKQADGYHLSQPGLLAKQFQISSPDIQIQSITVSQHDADLKVMYSDYKKVDDFVFPFTHIHTIKQPNNFHESKIKFSSIQTAPIYNTPFNIWRSYFSHSV